MASADAQKLQAGEQNVGGGATPHVLFIPSAGMGHLTPVFRVIAGFSSQGIDVSVVTVLPTVTAAETDFFAGLFADYPRVRRVDMHLLPLDDASSDEFAGEDPFFVRWEALRRSVRHLLGPIITTERVTAVAVDVSLASCVIPVAKELRVPCHVLFVSSATMLSLNVQFPIYLDGGNNNNNAAGVGDVDIPGVYRVPRSCVPPPLLDREKIFRKQFVANGRAMAQADSVLVNSFDAMEPLPVAALRGGKIVPGFPPVYAIGPLKSHVVSSTAPETAGDLVEWLGQQPARSVVYVSFGGRSAASLDQIREIAAGLEASGCRFLWVLKTTKVDRDDAAELSDELLGAGFLRRVRGKGVVTKAWVDQEGLLKHPAVGLFVSHGGWNSALEAATAGVPLLVWPQLGDHRVNAWAAVSAGLAVWAEKWGWEWDDHHRDRPLLVTGEEIAEKVTEVMANEEVRAGAARAQKEAVKAVAEGGTSYNAMHEFIAKLRAT